ncbi:MAG TPA: hypothetical protein VLJ18_08575 [Thermoanaerobaculia bacterium]|nr:hypothetical protein [Thermoanaerobaculia bacterium]
MKGRRVAVLGASAVLAGGAAFAVFLAARPASPSARFRPIEVAGQDLVLLPESERKFARVVIGLRPHGATGKNPLRGATDPRIVDLRRRLYALDFELLQGNSLTAVPAYATFYVAVPDPATVLEASGEEEADFRAYLATRLGWTEATIQARTRFFRVSRPLPYAQDMAEILGHDRAGRLVLGVGGDTDPVYAEPVDRISRAFPDDFSVRRLRGVHVGDINTEGGDLALSWLPDGSIGLLVGRHRAVRYLERRTGASLLGGPLTSEQIEEVRRAFSSAFFGVEVLIVGEDALRDPSRGSEELFHADMAVAAMRNATEAVAFVPTYEKPPVDANSREALPETFVRDVQKEYDLVARQMAARGYRVVRLPFEDHPVRSPVNVSKFIDATSGKPVVLLARHPEHRPPAPGVKSAMAQLQDALGALQQALDAWEAAPTEAAFGRLDASLRNAWRELDEAVASPNPLFDQQRALYEANGLSVVPVALFPSGEGGVHCLLLR